MPDNTVTTNPAQTLTNAMPPQKPYDGAQLLVDAEAVVDLIKQLHALIQKAHPSVAQLAVDLIKVFV